MTYKLYAVRIFTYDWPRAVAFYRDTLGMELVFESDAIGWAQFKVGESHIGIERCDPADEETKVMVGRFVGVSLEVEDIDETYAKLLAKGVEFTGKPERQVWGGTLAHLIDLDGNIVTLLGSNA